MKKIINTPHAPAPIGPYSQAVLVDKTLYVSGQVAFIPETGEMDMADIPTETKRVMENLKAVLTAADATFDNVVMTRTFSKIHGLAALRIGWMYAPLHVCDAVNRVRGPFNVNALAIAAGAAAIGDQAHQDKAIAHNDIWLERATTELTSMGLRVTPSVGNFLLMHFPSDPAKSAEKADAFLLSRGFVLRRVTAYGMPNALRLTIGGEEAMVGVLAALKEFLDG